MNSDRYELEYRLKNLETQNRSLNRLYILSQLAEQEERRRIFIKFHDGVVQKLIDAHMRLGTMAKKGSPLADKTAEFQALIKSAINDARILSYEISPHILYEIGLEAALREFLKEYQNEFRICSTLQLQGVELHLLGEFTNTMLYQLIQQLLLSLARESHAKNVNVWLEVNTKQLELSTEDDGSDFSFQENPSTEHFTESLFLMGVCEKVRFMGGDLQVEYSTGIRRVRVVIPLPDK